MVEIGESMIDGHGIIAKEFIPANSLIGISHVDVSKLYYEDQRRLPDHRIPFATGVFHNDLIRTPLGGFLNHSTNPNCMLIEEKIFWNLWTNEDIAIGDELCVDYALYRCGFKDNCE